MVSMVQIELLQKDFCMRLVKILLCTVRFGKRLSRAMTIKGVPSPLKRAVSTIMTPTRRSSMRRNDTSSISSASSMWDLDVSITEIEETCPIITKIVNFYLFQ